MMRRLWRLLHKQAAERQLDAELQYHVERQIAEYVAAGMSIEEAGRRARMGLGGIEQLKEESREARRMYFVEGLIQDLRFGVRMLRKNPGFTAIAILTLALGIGANTAIFSVFDAVMLSSLPVKDPGELVVFNWAAHHQPSADITTESDYGRDALDGSGENTGTTFSFPVYQQFSSRLDLFSAVAAMYGTDSLVNKGHGRVRILSGEYVSGNYFEALDVPAEIGRTLQPADDVPGAPPVAVLSDSKWRAAFGSDPGIVGSALQLSNHQDNLTVTIVGVVPRSFPSIRPGDDRDIWLPGSVQPWLDSIRFQGTLQAHRAFENAENDLWVYIVARLKPGMTSAQVQAAADVVFRNGVLHSGKAIFQVNDSPRLLLVSAQEAIAGKRGQFATPLTLLMAATGVVLLIACANVAGLMVARSATRRKEIALRLVLGAGRARIVRQLLAESLILSAAGGALGLLFAKWSEITLSSLMTRGIFHARLDGKVLGFSLVVSLVAGIAFGLATAFQVTRVNLAPGLNEASGGLSKPGRGGARWFSFGKALVVAQAALSLVSLVGAGLLVRTLRGLQNVDPGFDVRNLLIFWVDPGVAGSTDAQIQLFYSQLQDRVAALPGVLSVTHSNVPLLTGGAWTSSFRIEGAAARNRGDSQMLAVGPHFFETMGIPLLAGRTLVETDFGAPKKIHACLVNQSFAREFFPDQIPMGRRVTGFGRQGAECEIVGVVANTRYKSLRAAPLPILFSPQDGEPANFEVRTAGNPNQLVPAIRDQISRLEPGLPNTGFSTQSDSVERNLRQEILIARLSSLFGVVALLLACMGLYGLLSYEVTRRTRELGIRVALGAQKRDVLRMVVSQGTTLALVGSAIGIGISVGVMRFLSSLLYGVGPTDPATLAAVAVILALVSVAASYIPARRATKVDPLVALRYE